MGRKVAGMVSLLLSIFLCLVSGNGAMAAALDNRMSMDETPISFTMKGVEYSIPRNYLYQMDDWTGGEQRVGVSIRVVYPGLKPYSKETESCISRKIKCRVYDIYLTTADFSSEKNSGELINIPGIYKKTKPGPYGFTLIEVGPKDARWNLYETIVGGSKIIFDCQPYDLDGKSGAVCHHISHAKSGVAISYFFEKNDGLRDAVEVDGSIKQLIDGFVRAGAMK